MALSRFLTPAERRLAGLLFVLTLLGSSVRCGGELSPEVRTWLTKETGPAPTLPPTRGGRPEPASDPPVPVPEEGRETETVPGPGVRIDPNTASLEDLLGLPGVGPVLAGRILEDRRQNGPYRSLQDLIRVKGIGVRTLEKLRPHLRIDDPSPDPRRGGGKGGG